MIISLAQACLIDFILVDSLGAVVAGLGSGITVDVSKNGGAFASGTGAKTEIGDGWYTYTLSAAETDTAGPLAVTVTGAGAVQQNLLYQVSGSIWSSPAGSNILTAAEAGIVLRCEITDENMLMLLPQVDAYIENATGRDWTLDATIDPVAKAAARMLLVRWHEDPGVMAAGSALGFGLAAALVQLEAIALQLETSGIAEEALELSASFPADGSDEIAVGANLVLAFNHAMDTTATSAVTLKTASGAAVTVVNSLDVTKKILTVNPTGSLAAATGYILTITAAADIYGQTLTEEIGFRTA